MKFDMPKNENGVHDDDKEQGKKPANPLVSGKFSSENQPTAEAKARGWDKRRKGRNLFRLLLQLPADGSMMVVDPKTGQEIDQLELTKKRASLYFNVPTKEITVEMLSYMIQVVKSIKDGDTNAFNTIMDNAYGKPKEQIEIDDFKPPQIVLNYGRIGMQDNSGATIETGGADDVPPIAENEDQIAE